MEKFNLERALAGDPVVTRNGRKVNEIHYFKSIQKGYPVYAVIDNTHLNCYTKEGNFNKNTADHPEDLFMAPNVIQAWVNIYQGGGKIWVNHTVHNSEQEAKNAVSDHNSNYVKTIKITNEK